MNLQCNGLLYLKRAPLALLAVAGLIAAPAAAQIGTTTVDGGETVANIVAAYEWNTDGDFEGWAPNANINNAAVAGGVMSGESLGDNSFPNGADPFFNGPGGFVIGAGAGEVSRVQFAVQFNAGAPTVRTEMFLFPDDGTPFGSAVWAPGDFPSMTDGGVHVYNLDFDSSSPLWGASIGGIRLDPVADNQAAVDTFAYDYLRLGQIPEPASLGLAALGCLGLAGAARRRW